MKLKKLSSLSSLLSHVGVRSTTPYLSPSFLSIPNCIFIHHAFVSPRITYIVKIIEIFAINWCIKRTSGYKYSAEDFLVVRENKDGPTPSTVYFIGPFVRGFVIRSAQSFVAPVYACVRDRLGVYALVHHISVDLSCLSLLCSRKSVDNIRLHFSP